MSEFNSRGVIFNLQEWPLFKSVFSLILYTFWNPLYVNLLNAANLSQQFVDLHYHWNVGFQVISSCVWTERNLREISRVHTMDVGNVPFEFSPKFFFSASSIRAYIVIQEHNVRHQLILTFFFFLTNKPFYIMHLIFGKIFSFL